MIGNFLTRGLVMIFGYAYPAYECFKTVEKNKPEIEQLRFWCQYWILVALMTVFERIGDTFVSWVPMYSEAKLAFFIYLWHPKTKGTTYVYDSFFRPYVTKHEMEIDHSLLELRTRAGDIAVLYWQKAASYGQTRVFEILQYVAAQSTPRPRSAQPQQQNPRTRQPSTTAPAAPTAAAATAPPSRQPSTRTQVTQPQNEDPPSPTSSTASSHLQKQLQENEEPSSSQAPSASAAIALPPKSPLKKAISMPTPESSSQSATTGESESMRIEPVPPQPEKAAALAPPVSEETAMEEAIRVTRARLRNARSTSK